MKAHLFFRLLPLIVPCVQAQETPPPAEPAPSTASAPASSAPTTAPTLTPPPAPSAPSAPEASPTLTPSNHQEFAAALLQLLSDTEASLNICRDATSVQAALPQLRQLAERARELAAIQHSLPEPSLQDHAALTPIVERFNILWEAIRKHIARLEHEGLLTPELRDVLRIAPSEQP